MLQKNRFSVLGLWIQSVPIFFWLSKKYEYKYYFYAHTHDIDESLYKITKKNINSKKYSQMYSNIWIYSNYCFDCFSHFRFCKEPPLCNTFLWSFESFGVFKKRSHCHLSTLVVTLPESNHECIKYFKKIT